MARQQLNPDHFVHAEPRDALTFAALLQTLETGGRTTEEAEQRCAAWPDAERTPFLNTHEQYDYLPVPLARAYSRSVGWEFMRSVRVVGTADDLAGWLTAADITALRTMTIRTTDRMGPVLAALTAERVTALRELGLEWHSGGRADAPELIRFFGGEAARKLTCVRLSAQDQAVREAACRAVADGLLPSLQAFAVRPCQGLAESLASVAGRPIELHLEGATPTDLTGLAVTPRVLAAVSRLSLFVAPDAGFSLLPLADRLPAVQALSCTFAQYDSVAQAWVAALLGHSALREIALQFDTVVPELTGIDQPPLDPTALRRLALSHATSYHRIAADPSEFDAPLAAAISLFRPEQVESLALDRCVTGLAGTEVLSRWVDGGRLRHMAVSGCFFGPIPALGTKCDALESLTWSFASGGGQDVADFLSHPRPRLRSLTIESPQGGGTPGTAITRAPGLAGLTRLRLHGCGLQPPDLAALSRHVLTGVVELALSANDELDERSVLAFLAESGIGSLLKLDVSDLQLGEAFLDFLADWPGLKQLISLDMTGAFADFDETEVPLPPEVYNHPGLHFVSPITPEYRTSCNLILAELDED